MRKISKSLAYSFLIVSLLLTSASFACSVFRVTAKDGTIISGRTMEFGHDMQYAIVVVPRGKAFQSPTPDNESGLSWISKYGYVGIDVFGNDEAVDDGLNEAGLAVSGLWYESNMQWQKLLYGEDSITLAHVLLGSWILGNYSTVADVRRDLKDIKVFGYQVPQLGVAPPLHLAVYDANGGSIVIEYDAGQLHIYDNPLGIMTNAPNFPWHMDNLRNYVGMSNQQCLPEAFSGITIRSAGHGSGMFGLPGDITPPSRFVRMAVLLNFADRQENAKGLLNLSLHMVNSLNIIKGTAVDLDKKGLVAASETTQWAAFRDLTNKIFYFNTYQNQNLRKVDLSRLDFNTENVRVISMYEDQEIVVDLTDRAK